MPYILALDVSMGHSYSVLYKDDTCLFEDEIEHTQRGFHALLEEIQHLPERPLIVFEATGIYSRPVEKFFQDHHFSYCLLNPLEAKKQMEESTLRSWKTDKSDAHRLAQTHLKNQRQPKEVQSNFYLEMRDLARFYQEIEKKITRLRMDLHNCLQLTFPELEQFFSNRLTPYALTLIRLFPHPDFVLASTRTKIKNKLINETRKKISANRAEQKADQIIHYAQCAYPAVEKTVSTVKKRSITPNFSKIYSNKKSTGDTNDQKSRRLSLLLLYQTFPGIGALTAALLLGELGDITRFKTHKQLNAFVGIDIRRYHSGKYTGQDRINKRGNPKARKIIFFTIRNMIRQQRAALIILSIITTN
ncbi:IS110 family transposase [Enterococcus faecium]|nr:IS110 family transposase [Enterococcus faecium]